MSSSTRATRSRYSSPGQGPQAQAQVQAQAHTQGGGGPLEANKNSGNEASRAFMRRWMEPVVQNKPTFEEAGFTRYGVVENMQPLGTLPKGSTAAVKKSGPENTTGVVRKIVLKPSSGLGKVTGKNSSVDDASSGSGSGSNSGPGSGSQQQQEHTHRVSESRKIGAVQGNSSRLPSTNASSAPSTPPTSPSLSTSTSAQIPPQSSPRSKPSSLVTLRPPPPAPHATPQIILHSSNMPKRSVLPDLAPPPPSSRQSSRRSLTSKEIIDQDDGDDEDYQEPAMGTKRQSTAAAATATTPRSPVTRRSLTRASAGRASVSTRETQRSRTVVKAEMSADEVEEKRKVVAKVVADSVNHATKHHRYPTAFALRKLFDDNSNDVQMLAMIEDVFLQRADADTLDKFSMMITKLKQQGAADNHAYRILNPSSRATPERPLAAPFGELLTLDLSTVKAAGGRDGEQAQKKRKTTHSDSPSLSRSRRQGGGDTVSQQAEPERGDAFPSTGNSANTHNPTTPTRKHRRGDSTDSDSSLSTTISFDTPSVHGNDIFATPKATADRKQPPRTQIRLMTQPRAHDKKAELQQQGKQTSGTASKGASANTDANANANANATANSARPVDAVTVKGEEDLSGARGAGQPIAGRGKTAVTQRRPPAPTNNSGPNNPGHSHAHPHHPARPSATTAGTNSSADANAGTSTSSSSSLTTTTTSPIPPSSTARNSQDATAAAAAAAADAASSSSSTGTLANEMPGVVPPLFPNLPVKVSAVRSALQREEQDGGESKKKKKRSSASRASSAAPPSSDAAGAKKEGTSAPHDGEPSKPSTARSSPSGAATGKRSRRSLTTAAAAAAPATNVATRATRASRSSTSKRTYDEANDILSSPVDGPSRSGIPSAVTSRAVTPALPPPKRQRVGPRVKTSPKKNGNTTAGIPRPTGEGGISHVPGAASHRDQVENDDYCSSCGANGDLICCDNCSKSFHFECVDLVGEPSLPDEWYCNDCSYKLAQDRPVYRGSFSLLLTVLDKTIPRAFSLPKKVQNYFDGIKVGADGEYEEVDRVKQSKKDKNQEYDFLQQRDADGNPILCHACQKAAASNKLIMQCSACPLHWHIDCLDPPMAQPPHPRRFICPAHVGRFFDGSNASVGEAALPRRHRMIRGAEVVRPLYSRGMKNNGVIEVDDDEEEMLDAGWRDVRSYGRVLRLPAHGIKLDFLEQLRKIGAGRLPPKGDNQVQGGSAGSFSVNAADAEAVISLMLLQETGNQVAAPALAPAPASKPETLISRIQRGDIKTGDLSAGDKQSLRELMASIKAVLRDEPTSDGDKSQEILNGDGGISDGASTTPDVSEEAVTPDADITMESPPAEEAGRKVTRGNGSSDDEGSEGESRTTTTTSDGIEVVGDEAVEKEASNLSPADNNITVKATETG